MSPSSSAAAPGAAPGAPIMTITVDELLAASTTMKLDALVAKVQKAWPNIKVDLTGTIAAKQMNLMALARKHGFLEDSLCREIVQSQPQMQDELTAMKLSLHEAQQNAASAAADAAEAKAAALGVQEQVSSLLQEFACLKASIEGLKLQKDESAEAAKQKMFEPQTICFNLECAKNYTATGEWEQRQGSPLFEAVTAELRERGLASEAVSGVLSVRALRPQEGKPTPIVLTCHNVPAKVALLRGARTTGTGKPSLQMAARLTLCQQKQRKASLERLANIKEAGGIARLWGGYKLQEMQDGKWQDIA